MQNKEKKRHAPALAVWEMVVFAMLGTVMFCSKIIMEALPNIHLVGAMTMAYTVAFRKKALIPIYIRGFERTLRGLFCLVGTVYVYLDNTLDCGDAIAAKAAKMGKSNSVSCNLRCSRFCLRNTLRARTGDNVSS